RAVPRPCPQGLPGRGHPRRRQDHVRTSDRCRPAGGGHRPPDHGRRPDGAPEDPVGRRRRPCRHLPGPQLLQRPGHPRRPLPGCRGDLRADRHAPRAAPCSHRGRPHAGDPRRDPPRRRLPHLGRRRARRLRPATRRLALTGTPFRSDDSQIPFVTYEEGGEGFLRSKADYPYGYGEALRDRVVRPVLFMTCSGRMHWRTKTGDEVSAQLGAPETKDITQQAWRTALDPKGEWIQSVLSAADRRLTEVRRHVPDAGGLVIATDQKAARSYAATLQDLTGQAPTVVLSDDAGAGARIEAFSDSEDRWMVAVRMVSEGVDVPRLAVGVYATSTS